MSDWRDCLRGGCQRLAVIDMDGMETRLVTTNPSHSTDVSYGVTREHNQEILYITLLASEKTLSIPVHVPREKEKAQFSRRQADASISAVLLEDASIDYALVDSSWLETILGDVTYATDGLFEESKVELALAADVVLESVRDRHKRVLAAGKEDLGRPIDLSVPCINP